MTKQISKKRKLVGAWTLGLLIFGIIAVFSFQQVAGYTRSSTDDAFSSEYESKIKANLEKKGFLVSQKDGKSKETSISMPCTQISSCIAGMRSILIRKIIMMKGSNTVTMEDVKNFDFTFPSQESYRDNYELNIFDRNSQFSLNAEKMFLNNTSDKLTLIITLANRIDGVGTEQPDLLAIIPDFPEGYCISILRKVRNRTENVTVPVLEFMPNLVSHSQTIDQKKIITLPGYEGQSAGCVKVDNNFYYYQMLYEF